MVICPEGKIKAEIQEGGEVGSVLGLEMDDSDSCSQDLVTVSVEGKGRSSHSVSACTDATYWGVSNMTGTCNTTQTVWNSLKLIFASI